MSTFIIFNMTASSTVPRLLYYILIGNIPLEFTNLKEVFLISIKMIGNPLKINQTPNLMNIDFVNWILFFGFFVLNKLVSGIHNTALPFLSCL